MNILVIGSGGREHALVYKLKQSSHVDRIYCVPGNAGIAKDAICAPISPLDTTGLIDFARHNHVDFTVVGPEAPLVNGVIDAFENNGMPAFGPTRLAAELEGSKCFAKSLMQKYGIPTADFRIFDDFNQARRFIANHPYPLVIKADGLAAGKGAIVCRDKAAALAALKRLLIDAEFGPAGEKVVVEEFLQGEELSILALSDGEHLACLAPSQDHKQIFDGDRGPNTGGMGAYAPTPQVTPELLEDILHRILQPTVKGMALEGRPFKGVLYAGLMMTDQGPKVLEYNCRFGDPETQVVLPLVEGDLLEALLAAHDGQLHEVKWRQKNGAAVCVVIASGGYPDKYEKGKPIFGLETPLPQNILIFHAGTRQQGSQIVTEGGRVLGVTALAETLIDAVNAVYSAVGKLTFDGAYYRRDIAAKALIRGNRGR